MLDVGVWGWQILDGAGDGDGDEGDPSGMGILVGCWLCFGCHIMSCHQQARRGDRAGQGRYLQTLEWKLVSGFDAEMR